MPNTFYVAGPPSHHWRGVCEVNAERTAYKQHHNWPKRTRSPWTLFQQEGIDHLVAGKYWLPLTDSRLWLPKGL